jgi:hypothetical protein
MVKDEIDEDLLTGLKQAKTKRQFFAVVLKGGADGALIVSKQKIPPGEISEAKKKSGGSTVIQGACFVEEGTHIFETEKEPPATLAKTLKTIAKRDAGLIISTFCRTAIETLPAAGTSDAAARPVAPTPKAPPFPPQARQAKTPTPKPDLAAQWQQRSAALAGPLKQVLKEKLGDTPRIIEQFKQAQAFAAGQKFSSALNVLAEVERMVQAAQSPDAPPEMTDDEAAAIWKDRLDGLKAALKLVPAQAPEMSEIRAGVQKAIGLAGAKSFDMAHATLNEVDELVLAAQRQARQADVKATIKDGTVPFRKALLCWERAITDVTAEVKRLQSTMRSKYPDDADLAGDLSVILDEFEIGLDDVLKDGISATSDGARQDSNAAAMRLIAEFQKNTSTNELIQIADDCTFTKVAIQKTLTAALGELQTQLRA